MTWGRPLPPRLANSAVQYAPTVPNRAGQGKFLLVLGLAFVGLSIAEAYTPPMHWWGPIGWAGAAAGWLWAGAQMLLTARQARRAARDRYWPERPGPPALRITAGRRVKGGAGGGQ